jgi:hypothetical protein
LTTVPLRETVEPATSWLDRIRPAGARPAPWRVSAAICAAALAAILFFAAPGSVSLVRYGPEAGGPPASNLPAWSRACVVANRYPSMSETQLAFCARADGRVIGFVNGDEGETHLLVTGAFHITLVELKLGTPKPSWGSRIVAVGPLTTSDGLRELKAIRIVKK